MQFFKNLFVDKRKEDLIKAEENYNRLRAYENMLEKDYIRLPTGFIFKGWIDFLKKYSIPYITADVMAGYGYETYYDRKTYTCCSGNIEKAVFVPKTEDATAICRAFDIYCERMEKQIEIDINTRARKILERI